VFDSWYENPLDLPGRWYLQAIRELFKEPPRPGRVRGARPPPEPRVDRVSPLSPRRRESDDITTREQVFAARTSSEPRKVGSTRSWSPADTSVSSWARARSRRRGRRSRGGYLIRAPLDARQAGLALVDPVGGTAALRRSREAPRSGSGVALERAAFEKGSGVRTRSRRLVASSRQMETFVLPGGVVAGASTTCGTHGRVLDGARGSELHRPPDDPMLATYE
jgi:hypothetical protein